MRFKLIYPRWAKLHKQTEFHLPPHGPVVFAACLPADVEVFVSVEAREHHLHVTLDDDSFVQRARLRDVLAQAGAASGIQTHRSWWVAARAAVCRAGSG